MKSYLTQRFITFFRDLPEDVREQARAAYRFWKQDPFHPSLRFKEIRPGLWSVRIGRGWRALALREGEEINWIWVGSHAEYDSLIERL